jgi:eukaryotic-like serine/threonine-protein kinase
MPLTPGQVLQSRYRVIALLAQGGFGAVYQSWDNNLGKPVAIKENLDTSPEAQRQFQREASILSNLSHPNLTRVTDHFFIAGLGQYLVMDFVEGEDLQAMLDRARRPLPEAQVLAWIDQVCDALEYLHAQKPSVIHRDIKPANIKITPQGRAVLVDFGISKIYDPQLKTTLGARAVTPPYSPPEQYGQGSTDPRSDIYALGATLYTLLTGQEPPESVDRVSNGLPLTPPRQWMPSLSPQIDAAILRACEINRTQRYQSARELRLALRPKFISPTAAPQASYQRLAKFSSTQRVVLGVLGALGIVLIAAMFVAGNSFAPSPTAIPVQTVAIPSTVTLTPVELSINPTPTTTHAPTSTPRPTSTLVSTDTPSPTSTPTPKLASALTSVSTKIGNTTTPTIVPSPVADGDIFDLQVVSENRLGITFRISYNIPNFASYSTLWIGEYVNPINPNISDNGWSRPRTETGTHEFNLGIDKLKCQTPFETNGVTVVIVDYFNNTIAYHPENARAILSKTFSWTKTWCNQ